MQLRTVVALVFFAAALWRAGIDWMRTVAKGDAWRFKSTGDLWESVWPNGPGVLETLVLGYLGKTVWGAIAWVLSVPLVALLCLIGAFSG